MRASVDVKKVHKRFGNRFQFLFIYLREAHPRDGWKISQWSKIDDPKTFSGRSETAQTCTSATGFSFPTLVDTMDDQTAVTWAAWPERLFVIDTHGKVVYAGQQGPWGFWPSRQSRRRGGRSGRSGPNMNPSGLSLEEFLDDFVGKSVNRQK